MVGISLADIAALNADGLWQPEVMLTDDVAIRNNAVILFPIPLSQAGDTAAIRVIDIVEPAAGIVVEHIHAVCVGGKDDDVDFVSGRIIVICVSDAVADADTLIAQLICTSASGAVCILLITYVLPDTRRCDPLENP